LWRGISRDRKPAEVDDDPETEEDKVVIDEVHKARTPCSINVVLPSMNPIDSIGRNVAQQRGPLSENSAGGATASNRSSDTPAGFDDDRRRIRGEDCHPIHFRSPSSMPKVSGPPLIVNIRANWSSTDRIVDLRAGGVPGMNFLFFDWIYEVAITHERRPGVADKGDFQAAGAGTTARHP
jgi:hypothetical protein